jgi:thiol:disulfide interchange protein
MRGDMERRRTMLFVGVAVIVVLAGLAIVFYGEKRAGDNNTSSQTENGSVAGTTSDADEAYKIALAKDLATKGMVMYGAYWCTHCKSQKEKFGDAFQYIDYVECDAKGENANPDECAAQGIEGYPTWIYQGQKYSGEQSLEKLAQIVGFEYNAE